MISRVSAKTRSFLPLSSLQNILNYYHTIPDNSHFHPSETQTSISAPKTPPNLDFTPPTVLETLYSYANDWKRALEFFNWVETQSGFQHTTETYNRIIDILGKVFEFNTCWELISRMSKHEVSLPNHHTFRVMFKRYVSAHMIEETIEMFNTKLGEFGLKDKVSFLNLIDALCEYKHVVEAEELCFTGKNDFVKGCGFDVCLDTKVYNMILRGWYKIGWWKKCREFWKEMDRKGVEKDVYSYSIYMDIECKRGKPLKAVSLYGKMKTKGIGLDVVAYNTVIRAIGITDGVDFAVRVFREMIELRCQPSVVTYNILLKLYCKHGRYMDMYKMLDDMRKEGCEPNVMTFHGLFSTIENPREIVQLFERMVEMGIRPRMDTFVMLMRKFERWGFLRPLFALWKKIEEHGLSPDEFAYNALIDALAQKGMIDMARMYDEEMYMKGLTPKLRAELKPKTATVTGLLE